MHELGHVQQHQHHPNLAVEYAGDNATVGYHANPYELEARYYGRLADPTASKHTGPAGPHLGKQVWGLRAP